jgi:hypothetical protein
MAASIEQQVEWVARCIAFEASERAQDAWLMP